jgi:hypothetical protein
MATGEERIGVRDRLLHGEAAIRVCSSFDSGTRRDPSDLVGDGRVRESQIALVEVMPLKWCAVVIPKLAGDQCHIDPINAQLLNQSTAPTGGQSARLSALRSSRLRCAILRPMLG